MRIDVLQAEMNMHRHWLHVNVPRLIALTMKLSDRAVTSDGVMSRRGKFSRTDPLEFFFGKGIAA